MVRPLTSDSAGSQVRREDRRCFLLLVCGLTAVTVSSGAIAVDDRAFSLERIARCDLPKDCMGMVKAWVSQTTASKAVSKNILLCQLAFRLCLIRRVDDEVCHCSLFFGERYGSLYIVLCSSTTALFRGGDGSCDCSSEVAPLIWHGAFCNNVCTPSSRELIFPISWWQQLRIMVNERWLMLATEGISDITMLNFKGI